VQPLRVVSPSFVYIPVEASTIFPKRCFGPNFFNHQNHSKQMKKIVVLIFFALGSIYFIACNRDTVNPDSMAVDAVSAATAGDSTKHKGSHGDSLRHKKDSLHHKKDSLGIKRDSLATKPKKSPKKKG
jgi:hypothetical protein